MPGAGARSSAASASIPTVPGRAPRTLLPAWTISHAINLPPEPLSPPGAGWKDSEGAGARCCVWPGTCRGLCRRPGLCLELLLCQCHVLSPPV